MMQVHTVSLVDSPLLCCQYVVCPLWIGSGSQGIFWWTHVRSTFLFSAVVTCCCALMVRVHITDIL